MLNQTTNQPVSLFYLGRPGSDFAFKIAGIKTITVDNQSAVLAKIKVIIDKGNSSVVFINEELVTKIQDKLYQLTNSATCSVVLLPSPTKPKHLAAKQMDKLMVRAVGSDIFNK